MFPPWVDRSRIAVIGGPPEHFPIIHLHDRVTLHGPVRQQFARLFIGLIDLCITNRHYGHKKAGSSEAVMKDRRSSGRFRAFLVIRHSAAMSSARLSGRPLASVALKWVQTNSSGFRSGA